MKRIAWLLVPVLLFTSVFTVPAPASAVVSVETCRSGPYAGAGTTGPFAYGFRIFASSDLRVIKTSTAGVDSLLVNNVDYTVSGVGVTTGGTVTLTTALATGEQLTLIRDMPYLQSSSWSTLASVTGTALTLGLDKLDLQIQQVQEKATRALTLPESSSLTDVHLPTPRAGKGIVWGPTATTLEEADTDRVYSVPDLKWIADYTDLADASAEFSTSQDTLLINQATTVTDDLTIQSTMSLMVLNGGVITVASGKTLTIEGPIIAGPYPIFAGSGTIKILGQVILVDWWGTDSASIQKAFDAIPTSTATFIGPVIKFQPLKTYTIDAAVALASIHHTTVDARGAHFYGSLADIWFDLNSSAIITGTSTDWGSTIRRGVKWIGGIFERDNSSAYTGSICFKAYNTELLELRPERVQGFEYGLSFMGADELHVIGGLWYDNLCSIHLVDTAETAKRVQNLLIEGAMFTLPGTVTSTLPAIHLEDGIRGLRIRDNDFAGEFPHYIKISDSGTVAVPTQGVWISNNHFEHGATAAQSNVYFDDVNGNGFLGVNILSNDSTREATGWVGYNLNRVLNAKLDGNYFQDTSGGGTEVGILVGPNCERIRIGEANYYGATVATQVALDTTTRDEVTIEPSRVFDGRQLTGYTGAATFSTGNATLDMSSVFAGFPTGTLPPKSYLIRARIKDSGGSGSLTLRTSSSGTVGGIVNLPASWTAGVYNELVIPVEADANGDIYISYTASGSGTATIVLQVLEYRM